VSETEPGKDRKRGISHERGPARAAKLAGQGPERRRQLVLALIYFLHELLERQAVRRIEESLTPVPKP